MLRSPFTPCLFMCCGIVAYRARVSLHALALQAHVLRPGPAATFERPHDVEEAVLDTLSSQQRGAATTVSGSAGPMKRQRDDFGGNQYQDYGQPKRQQG